jgi:hypothetical protein
LSELATEREVRIGLERELSETRARLAGGAIASPPPVADAAPEAEHDETGVATLPKPPDRRTAPRWGASAQRDLAAVLATASDWRAGLRDVIRILGVHGNWDSVAAWAPDEHQPTLRCFTNWTAREELRTFETTTWHRQLPIAGTQLGRALFSIQASLLRDIAGSDDQRLGFAADAGMAAALLVPVRDGRSAVAVLELLSSSDEQIDEQVVVSMEAIAFQLAHFRRLLRMGAQPRWRLGRF